MASFIGDLQQSQQQAQDANAYRALVRQAEDDSLARNAVAKSRAEYDNAHMGYGLTRADIAKATGRPTSEVSMDTLGDAELQQLGYAKQASQRAALEEMARMSGPRPEVQQLSPEEKARQIAMQQAAQDTNAGRLGLAGQMTGRANPALADRFLNSIPNPGSFEMNANKQTSGNNIGEITDSLPEGDRQIRELKQRWAY
mgnify:CR=1 FL=1